MLEVSFYWAVPVFFMLTGVTLLDYRKRYSTKVFYNGFCTVNNSESGWNPVEWRGGSVFLIYPVSLLIVLIIKKVPILKRIMS